MRSSVSTDERLDQGIVGKRQCIEIGDPLDGVGDGPLRASPDQVAHSGRFPLAVNHFNQIDDRMLAFLHQATRRVPRSVFAFGTTLTCLDTAFRLPDADDMLAATNDLIQDYAGGTRLGDSLSQLRERYARKLIGRRTLVLLISDGLDTGSPDTLDQELRWLHRNCRKILWLNPLLRYTGYAPLAAGAKALDRHADGMLAIHNLERLEDLAQGVARLLQR